MIRVRQVTALIFASLLLVATSATAVVTNLSIDVAQSIDDGLAQLDAWGAYTYPGCSANDATGLTLMALMEKRLSADPDDPAQGYAAASAEDQARMENAVRCILDEGPGENFYAYRDGQNMMALALYLRTGGPDPAGAPESVLAGLNRLFDRTAPNQNGLGYWCYTDGGCNDASTTQFVVNGMAGARAVYSDASWSDPGRLATLNAALALTRNAYVSANQTGGPGGICDAEERGHGYNRVWSPNSLQQTAAGAFAQLNGGGGLNDVSVQQYLRWIYNRYRYTNIAGNDWGNNSYWYYLWASTKAFEYIEGSGVVPSPGSLTVADMGTLAAGTCAGNEENRDPAADGRVARFGAEGAGYYDDHPPGFYYDYAYTLLSSQTGAVGDPGNYTGPGSWNNFSRVSYAILVLQRSVGGAPPFEPAPAVPVPTLSQWAVMLLVLLLGGIGFWRRRHSA